LRDVAFPAVLRALAPLVKMLARAHLAGILPFRLQFVIFFEQSKYHMFAMTRFDYTKIGGGWLKTPMDFL
jgi:hypothetical protein